MMKSNMLAASAALIMLSACGGGGTGGVDMVPTSPPQTGTSGPSTPAQPADSGTSGPSAPAQPTSPANPAPSTNALQTRLEAAGSVRRTISTLGSTPGANVPVSGTSTFSGPALLKVSRGTASYAMVGDSRLDLDFGSRQMSGGITNLQGSRENGTTFSAPGRITYDTGAIRTGQNVFTLDYDGNLSVGNDSIALNGTAVGGILGSNASAIQALDGTPGTDIVKNSISSMTVEVNGQPAVGEMLILGQK